jgi:hypothetical protein
MNKPYLNSNIKGSLRLLPLMLAILVTGSSCGAIHNLFAPKSGCPSDGKNVGAERILSGEKVPKASKFKA